MTAAALLRVLGAALMLSAVAPAGAATAQGLAFGGDSDQPVEIHAEDGIEWQQQALVFTARGNARATRGDVVVRADVLNAFYRRTAAGGTEIWRLDAEGGVTITSPGEKAFAEKGVYDVDNAILVLSGGKRVRLVADGDEISADGQLEYWERKQMAVARGDARATRGDRRLRADVLAAYLERDRAGKSRIHHVEAFDNVTVTTAADVVTADHGVYDVGSGMATLTGDVRIARGDSRLAGCSAEINLNTGVSTLKACPSNGGAAPRVRGLFRPGKKPEKP